MADTLTITSPEAITLDWLLTPVSQRDPTLDLVDAVVIALGTDRRANSDDALPRLHDDDRRGWWGDLDAAALWNGWPIGTRHWLLERAKITQVGARQGPTVVRAEDYAREALRPFREKRIASRIEVRGELTGTERVNVTATLYRGPQEAIALNYQTLWGSVGA